MTNLQERLNKKRDDGAFKNSCHEDDYMAGFDSLVPIVLELVVALEKHTKDNVNYDASEDAIDALEKFNKFLDGV